MVAILLIAAFFVLIPVGVLAARAQDLRAGHTPIPNFWDVRSPLEKPDMTGFRSVRFLVNDDFPPLAFAGPDESPTGFSVELSRAVCEKLGLTCTIQVRPFGTLLDALGNAQGDVVAAAFPVTPALREKFAVTNPYFKIPARFVTRQNSQPSLPEVKIEAKTLAHKKVGAVAGTAHEAYLKTFLPQVDLKPYPNLEAVEAALKAGEIDYAFGDGLNLALWIGGTGADDCCTFIGGPYLESRFFGEGIGFILRPDDQTLRRAIDYALQELWKDGTYADLYLRFFPVNPYGSH